MKKYIEMLAALAVIILFAFKFYLLFLLGFVVLLIWVFADLAAKQYPRELVRASGLAIQNGFKHWVDFIRMYVRESLNWFYKQTQQVQIVTMLFVSVLCSMVIWQLLPNSTTRSSVDAVSSTANVAAAVPYPDLVPAPLGALRYQASDVQRAWRVKRIIETRMFWIMREGDAVGGAARINQPDYQKYIDAAAKMYDVSRSDIEAIHYLESFGNTEAKSPTGPIGPGQFTVRTAASIGEVFKGGCFLKFKGVSCGVSGMPANLPPIEVDNRKDVQMSVYATAKLLSLEKQVMGDTDLAIMAYHSGDADVKSWVKKYIEPNPVGSGGRSDIQKYGLTYDKIYFNSTPYYNPGTYSIYRKIMDDDWGPNYPWKVRCAAQAMDLYRKDKAQFQRVADTNKFRGKRAKYRMWTFYRDSDKPLVDVADLKKGLRDGTLVTIPQNPEKFGFSLRLEGAGMVAELDKQNQTSYLATQIPEAGLALWIGTEFQKLRAGHSSQVILNITSASRTVEYQEKLTKSNPVATKELSFHVLGLAFDIAKSNLDANAQRDLQFVLDELDSTGMISWVPEIKAYHVVVAPDPIAREFFTRFYNDNKEFQVSSPLVVGDWH